ncbi:hypothetical protein STEG23_028691, partial [Scotinomys teguina]
AEPKASQGQIALKLQVVMRMLEYILVYGQLYRSGLRPLANPVMSYEAAL